MSQSSRYGVCLFCQHGLSARASRRPNLFPTRTGRRFETNSATASTRHDTETRKQLPRAAPGLTFEELNHQLQLNSPVDVLREEFFYPNGLHLARRMRRKMKSRGGMLSSMTLNGSHADTLNHALKRQDFIDSATVAELLELQLDVSNAIKPLHRVFTVAMQSPNKELVRALVTRHRLGKKLRHLFLDPTKTWPGASRLINLVIARYDGFRQESGLPMIWIALLGAASTNALTGVRKYLKIIAEEKAMSEDMHTQQRRLIEFLTRLRLAQLKGNHLANKSTRRGLEEILLGFSDSTFYNCHVRALLPPWNRELLYCWISLLADLKRPAEIWAEWERSRETFKAASKNEQGSKEFAVVVRAFILELLRAGWPSKAWALLSEHGRLIRSDDSRFWGPICRQAELQPPPPLKEPAHTQLSGRLLWNLTHKLERLELSLGINWIPGQVPDSEGFHVPIAEYEEARDELADPQLKHEAASKQDTLFPEIDAERPPFDGVDEVQRFLVELQVMRWMDPTAAYRSPQQDLSSIFPASFWRRDAGVQHHERPKERRPGTRWVKHSKSLKAYV